MRRGFVFLLAAALVAGCAQTYSGQTASPGVLLNTTGSSLLYGGTGNLFLAFNALGTGVTVTAVQSGADGNTVYTATPSSGCTNVAAIAGSTTATTSAGPAGAFTVTALALNQQCTITIASNIGGAAAIITVNTSYVATAAPTGITVQGKGR